MDGDRHLYNLVQAAFIVIKILYPDKLSWFDVCKPLIFYFAFNFVCYVIYSMGGDNNDEENNINDDNGQQLA